MASVHLSTYNMDNNIGTMMRAPLHPQPQQQQRPSTPSFRIVSSPAINPSPTFTEQLEVEEDGGELFEDVLSPKKLRSISGSADLTQIISLDLVVDTTESSLGSFGNYLPNLRELRLSGSKITTVRDLGTSLRTLEVLWMSRCGLQDLDGICSVGELKELYLSYNEISELSPLSMIDTLQLVDIDSNNVSSLEQVEFLCMCPDLTTLNIEWNPVTQELTPAELQKEMLRILPNLKYLDDQPLTGGKAQSLSTREHRLLGNTGNLHSEIRVVNSAVKESITDERNRPKSAKSRPVPESESRESETPSPTLGATDHSSELTQGVVICGPPSKLLTKMSRAVKENILNRAMDRASSSSPPQLMAAWSENPDDMLSEWRDSRDWLSRELTMNTMNENKDQGEKQANFEAALQDTPRIDSPRTRLNRPSRRSPSSCTPRSPTSNPCTPVAVYDECVDVDPRGRASPKIQRKHSGDVTDRTRKHSGDVTDRTRKHSGDVTDRTNRYSKTYSTTDSKKDRSRPSFERESPNSASKSAEFSKSRPRAGRTTSKSYDSGGHVSSSQPISAQYPGHVTRSSKSPTEGGPIRATYRPADSKPAELRALQSPGGSDVTDRKYKHSSDVRPSPKLSRKSSNDVTDRMNKHNSDVTDRMNRYSTLPSPPSAKPAPPSGGKPGSSGAGAGSQSMGSRFRRMKVSVEEQVAQQAVVDVLYSDKMPKPALTRHTRT